jgi:galactose mutarotase-like enzyme
MDALRLRSDELEVLVLPWIGARMHSITAFGELVTHTPDDLHAHELAPYHWGGYHMAPWCNRITPGVYDVAGRELELAANFDDGSAIHGFHIDTPWESAGHDTFVAEGGGGDGWPWQYAIAVTYGVLGPTLSVRYLLTNLSDSPMPGGVGFHPWFRVPTRLRIPSATVFPDNTSTAALPDEVSEQFDLRRPAPLAPGIDACWADLHPPVLTMWWDELGITLDYSGRRTDAGSVLAVAAHLPQVGGAAVELQTHAPAGLRRLLDAEPYPLDLLAPGAALQLHLDLTFSRS